MNDSNEDVGLSNTYIDGLLKSVGCVNFLGVYSCDNIAEDEFEKRGPGTTLIANLSAEGERGSHFVCIVAKEKSVLYIDSLALGPCVSKDILAFLQRTKKKILYNKNIIQYPQSLFCGFYSMLYVMLHDEKMKIKPKINFSSRNLIANDAKCIKYILFLVKNNVHSVLKDAE
jgi:hypothetical protein